VAATQTGRDGKTYPAQMPPPRAWRYEVVVLTHELAHGQGLSERATQRELAARGYRRSSGSVHYDLSRPMVRTCPACRAAAGLPEPPPPPPVRARKVPWH
jgi:hypothetical protein